MRSASVDLPWSMWAMIEKLRMCAWSAMRAAIQDRRRRGAGAGGPTPAAPCARSADRRAGRQRLVVGQRDTVAPAGLDLVERAVGAGQQQRVALARLRHGDAD